MKKNINRGRTAKDQGSFRGGVGRVGTARRGSSTPGLWIGIREFGPGLAPSLWSDGDPTTVVRKGASSALYKSFPPVVIYASFGFPVVAKWLIFLTAFHLDERTATSFLSSSFFPSRLLVVIRKTLILPIIPRCANSVAVSKHISRRYSQTFGLLIPSFFPSRRQKTPNTQQDMSYQDGNIQNMSSEPLSSILSALVPRRRGRTFAACLRPRPPNPFQSSRRKCFVLHVPMPELF